MMKTHEAAVDMLCELKKSGTRLLVERSGTANNVTPFLFENNDIPKVGNVYSDIGINKFEVDHKTFDFVLDADVRMAEEYKSIMVYADICDESDPAKQFWTSEKTVLDVSSLNYHQEGNLKEAFGAHEQDRAAVLLYVDLTDDSGTQTHVVKLEYEAGAEIIHSVTHPKRQSGYLTFGDGTNPKPPETCPAIDDRPGAKKDNIVTIALFRAPTDVSDLDYLCDFGKCDPSEGNQPILAIPIEGDFKIQEAEEIIADGRFKPSITCTISKTDFDGVLVVASSVSEYDTAVGCTVTKNKLHYDLTEFSWQKTYQESGLFDLKKYVYTIRFDVHYKLNDGDIINLTRQYSSGDVLNQGSDEKLSYLVLEWGCLDEKTEILMANGNSKKIKDIASGECVRAANGSSQRVKNVWTGTGSDCRVIKSERGTVIMATQDHPFPTDGGWKRASEIKVGDMLFDANGDPVRVEEISKTDKAHNVVNLEFDMPTVIIANGLQTGDHSSQNGSLPNDARLKRRVLCLTKKQKKSSKERSI